MISLIVSVVALLAATSPSEVERCRTVSGTYAVYANHDLLHVDGSRHFVAVSSGKLDGELQRRGWERTVARGRFTICGAHMDNPKNLGMQDQVELRLSSDVHYGRPKASAR